MRKNYFDPRFLLISLHLTSAMFRSILLTHHLNALLLSLSWVFRYPFVRYVVSVFVSFTFMNIYFFERPLSLYRIPQRMNPLRVPTFG